MSTPQDSPRRRKQKARRTKQLAEWRATQDRKATAGGATPAAKAEKPAAKAEKPAAKRAAAK